MPVTNGAIPAAPEGGQSSQSGTLSELERAAVPVADDRPDAGEAAGADAPGPAPAPLPGVAAELLGAVAAVDGAAALPGNVTAP